MGKSMSTAIKQPGLQSFVCSQVACPTLDKLLNLSEPQRLPVKYQQPPVVVKIQ